jgi:hypothetical protein
MAAIRKDPDLLSEKRSAFLAWKPVAAITTGFLVVILILFIANFVLTDAARGRGGMDPVATCTTPPLGCWDGLSKNVDNQCNVYEVETRLRSDAPLAPPKSRSCYKSIYWNSDANTLIIVSLLLAWALTTARAFEHAVLALMDRTLRLRALAALVLGVPSMWYVVGAPIHYLNDRFGIFWTSQVFYSTTEALSFAVTSFHMSRSTTTSPALASLQGGIATAHLVQLFYDENFLVYSGNAARTAHLFACDASALVLAVSLLRESGFSLVSVAKRCSALAAFFLLVFHVGFADFASGKLF